MKNNFLSKTKIPEKLPLGMQRAVDKIKKIQSQSRCLIKAYEIMIKRYRGRHFMVYTRPIPIFSFDIEKLWNRAGLMHCHNMNYLMRILLVKSGFFKNEDIENHWTIIKYISLHQYLRVRLDNDKHIDVDIWGASHGVKFGNYLHWL